jgi:hypothetical protein
MRVWSITNDGKSGFVQRHQCGNFPGDPVAGIQAFNRAGMPAILEENAKTNRGLRQGS